jgi:hypothetical protein
MQRRRAALGGTALLVEFRFRLATNPQLDREAPALDRAGAWYLANDPPAQ